jgi:hypothetical protein
VASAFGTEISFRLGPGGAEEARRIADRLGRAAAGCRRHVLFADDAGGAYGCLAEWEARADAERYAGSPEVARELAALARRLGREPHVRLYAMEERPAPPGL